MNVDDIVSDIQFLFISSHTDWDVDDINEDFVENVYTNLYELRKNLLEVIKQVPIESLRLLVQSIQKLKDNLELLPTDILEEVEMYLSYERIEEKLIEYRQLFWDDVVNR